MTFGKRLKNLREEQSFSQRTLADKLGIGNSTLAMYELDNREPDNEIISRIADFFDVSIDYLFGRSNDRRPRTSTKAIDDPEVTDFMKNIVGEFRLDPSLTPKDRHEIMEDLAEYFRYKLHQKKNKD